MGFNEMKGQKTWGIIKSQKISLRVQQNHRLAVLPPSLELKFNLVSKGRGKTCIIMHRNQWTVWRKRSHPCLHHRRPRRKSWRCKTAQHLLSVWGMGEVDVTPLICHYLSHHKSISISIEEGNVEFFLYYFFSLLFFYLFFSISTVSIAVFNVEITVAELFTWFNASV